MSDHDCLGLLDCYTHPKWTVIRSLCDQDWIVYPPMSDESNDFFPSHAEAISHADREARRG